MINEHEDKKVPVVVRDDLNWLLNTPSLIRLPEEMNGTIWLQQFQLSNLELPLPVAEVTKRLGIYYENLVNHLIKNTKQAVDLKRNIQVNEAKVTVGEFDLLGRYKNENFHLECAVKFYLQTGSGSQLEDYIGPNKHDKLSRKVTRLLEKQITLSDTDTGKLVCQALDLLPNRKLILLQGYLFYPYSNFISCNFPLCPELNPDHYKGWWMYADQIEILESSTVSFCIMEKPDWLSFKPSTLFTFRQLAGQLKNSEHPQLIARVDNNDGKLREIDRGFVVPNNW